MKILLFIFLFFDLIFSEEILIKEEKHTLIYKGIHIGYIKDLNNYIDNKTYILGIIENDFFKFLRGSETRVLYKDDEPTLNEDFFKKKDKNSILNTIKSIKDNNKNNTFNKIVIDDNKFLNYNCFELKCNYEFYKNDKLKSNGEIIFDNSNNITYFFDIKNNLILSKKN